jgi:hypothetical protein
MPTSRACAGEGAQIMTASGRHSELEYQWVHMEEVQPVIIPTVSKSKIPSILSYPIGAEAISAALALTPQLAEIRLNFFFYRYGLRRGEYEFLRVEYLHNSRAVGKWPISYLYGRPLQSRWEVVVQPVPRVFRHRVKQYALDSALPLIARWLVQRVDLACTGHDLLTFFYDQMQDDFISRPLTHLEPLRD